MTEITAPGYYGEYDNLHVRLLHDGTLQIAISESERQYLCMFASQYATLHYDTETITYTKGLLLSEDYLKYELCMILFDVFNEFYLSLKAVKIRPDCIGLKSGSTLYIPENRNPAYDLLFRGEVLFSKEPE